ncbi:laminin subunit alpha [Nephila pilipes]|uniref:Laminin subunit alpha n=1 Tax=Nephila pilipes TaxID=299642 RepID=A0A8X6QCB9_NEPPI|nr:laminin subunit alpha [Nephila pilipes]
MNALNRNDLKEGKRPFNITEQAILKTCRGRWERAVPLTQTHIMMKRSLKDVMFFKLSNFTPVSYASFPSLFVDDLSAPLEVLVEQTTSSSVHLSWKPPPSPKGRNLKLFTYSLTLTPLTHYGHAGLEKEFSLPPSITSKLVDGLTEGTRYVVQLSAIYGDNTQKLSHDTLVRVAAPKFTVFIPPEVQQDIPVGDDGLPPDEPRK